MNRSKTKRIVLRYRRKKPAPYESPALNQRVGFFDLPLEVRQMIYHLYYGSVEPVFRHYGYHTSSLSSSSSRRPEYAHKSKLSGVPDMSLHQVSKSFVSDATPIWHAKSTTCTIIDDQYCKLDSAVPAFIHEKRGLLDGLKRRLISLEIIATRFTEEHLSWVYLMKSCPKLRIIDFTFEEKKTTWGSTQPVWMSREFQEDLDDDPRAEYNYSSLELDGLEWLLAQLNRGDWRLTRGWRTIRYAGKWVSRDQAPKNGHMFQTDLKYTTGANGYTAASKVFTTSEGIRGRWLEGAAKPSIAKAGSDEWEDMILTPIDGGDVWALP